MIQAEWISAIVTAMVGCFALFGVYNTLTIKIALLEQRISIEEEHTEKFAKLHEGHETKINDTVLNIERQLSEIKVLIEQKKT